MNIRQFLYKNVEISAKMYVEPRDIGINEILIYKFYNLKMFWSLLPKFRN